MWEMIGAALISSGIIALLLGALGAMTWGRIKDTFETIKESEAHCRANVKECINELFETTKNQGERIAKLEGKGGTE